MCGIGGFWGEPGVGDPAGILESLDRFLHHRGPDQGGSFTEDGIGLVIRRLCIIDLITGDQPITSEDGNVVTVFNGEIYNHRELRRDLEARGHTFRSRADTEVIVHLYEEEGVDFLHRLRGMFAIALWDRSRRRLLLARDRLGIKPLFYAPTGNGLLFASEIPALLAAGASTEIDMEGLGAFFRLGYVPAPVTCYRQIRSLPPGSLLIQDDAGSRTKRWWRLAPRVENVPGGIEEARVRLRELVEESVRLRLISDVPLGAFLSGGLDSTLVVGTMARLMARPVETFTIGFDVPGYDETDMSRRAGDWFETNQHVQVGRPEAVDLVDEVVRGFGQPFADPSSIPTLLVSRLARQQVTVALSGDGGDELFGGYKRYGVARTQRWYDRVPRPLRSTVARSWPRRLRGSGMIRIAAHSFAGRYLENNAMTTAAERLFLLEPEFGAAASQHPFRLAEDLVCRASHEAREIQDLLFLDLHSYLPDVILAKVDRMSMSCSLEARVPLLDHELVEFVFSLPLSWRMGEQGSKRLLREAFQELYPAEIRQRGKMGFRVPLGAWLSGPLKERVRALPDSIAAAGGPLRAEGVRKLVDMHLSGRRDTGRKLWAIMVFDAWWRRRSRFEYPAPQARDAR